MMILLLLSCVVHDTEENIAYSTAELLPPFAHGNAGWAGVALLDYDQDGWLDIFFPNGLSQRDALYRNLGNGQFVDVAQDVGLDSLEQHGAAVSGDLDNDGDPDLVVTKDCSLGTLQSGGEALHDGAVFVYWNDKGVFRKQSVPLFGQALELGICPISVELYDINVDGFLDISISNGFDLDQIYPWIYRKETREGVDVILFSDGQGKFDTPAEINSVAYTSIDPQYDIEFQFTTFTSAYMDINRDGLPDKISGFGGGALSIYLQEEPGYFVIHPELTPQVEGLWMGLALADYDGDGDIDIYSTNQGLSPLIVGYNNIPGPRLNETVTEDWLIEHVRPFHTVFDNDGGKFVASSWSMESEHELAGDVFEGFESSDGEILYTDWSSPQDLERFGWGWAAVTADIDADGWMDVVFNGNNCSAPLSIVGSEEQGAGPGGVLRNKEGKGFADKTWEWGLANLDTDGNYPDGRGLAVGDLNNDGYPDFVYANRSYNPSQSGPMSQVPGIPNVWLSEGKRGNWLQVDLVGTVSNRDGIGSMIRIDTGERKHFYVFEPGGTTNSSNERLFSVGVGSAEKIDIVVLFPSGKQVRYNGVQANQRIVIHEQ
jgi:hypothetical protein